MRHSAEEIVNKLGQAEVELGRGSSVAPVCKLLGVTEQTYKRWHERSAGGDIGRSAAGWSWH